MNINPDMLVLAREYRNYTQEELARKLFVSQATIAKIEGGVTTDIQESLFDRLCSVLNLPVEFFSQNEDVIGFGSSAYFYRKKSKISVFLPQSSQCCLTGRALRNVRYNYKLLTTLLIPFFIKTTLKLISIPSLQSESFKYVNI